MKSLFKTLRNSKGVVMVVAMLIMLAVAALSIGMITSAMVSSAIAKNYKAKIKSFYAADGPITVLSQAVIDTLDTNWVGTPTAYDTSYRLKANSNSRYVTLVTDSLDAGGTGTTDSSTGASFKLIPSGSHFLIQEVSTGKFVELNATNWLVANTNKAGATPFDFPACSYTAGDSGKAIYSPNSGTNKYCAAEGSGPLDIRSGSCSSTSSTAWERFFWKKVITASQYVGYASCENRKVQWIKSVLGAQKYSLKATAYDSLQTWGKVFKTTLNQYIEMGHDSLMMSTADTVWQPVVYRDFHQDRTCPEFEQPHWAAQYGTLCGCAGANIYCPSGCNPTLPCSTDNRCLPALSRWKNTGWKDMVAKHLDSDHKPWFDSTQCHSHINRYIKYWYRDWMDSTDNLKGEGYVKDSTIPVYFDTASHHNWSDTVTCWWHQCGTHSELNGADSICKILKRNYDTAFKNYHIDSTIPFTWSTSHNCYFFSQTNFFPLNHTGFHDQPWQVASGCGTPNHAYDTNNYSWTMEIQTTIILLPNQYFKYAGDDDLWLFINDSLVMELGGPTNGSNDSISTNNLTWLQYYQPYRFSLFYTERHSVGQNLTIYTNMLAMKTVTVNRRSWTRSYGNVN